MFNEPHDIMKTFEINDIREQFGNDVSTNQLRQYASEVGVSYPTAVKRLAQYKVGRGKWDLTIEEAREKLEMQMTSSELMIPQVSDTYVPFGNFKDVKKILGSKQFYPMFITGLSGNGKTLGVEQACAQLGRELIRVNITIETDEDDLIGGFRLVDGSTAWHDGPVVSALERGGVLLLDEIDLASNKILCLQSVLEGKGLYLKKTGRFVAPAPGFTVVATANTKGKGSEDGRFIGTNVLNEAFLERFPITFEQEYPTNVQEVKMLNKICDDTEFNQRLCDWSEGIRKTFYDGGMDEVISTRRLVHIVQAYKIFGDKMKAIEMCINRFDEDTKQSFLQLYAALDENLTPKEENDSEA